MKPDVSISERIKALENINTKIDELSNRYHTVDVEADRDFVPVRGMNWGINKLASKVIRTNSIYGFCLG